MKGSRNIAVLVVLHVMLIVYSCTDIVSKYAATSELFSLTFIVLWFCVLALMGLYAIGWQQVIRHIPLTTAFANKAITIVWGIFWGAVLFGEAVTAGKVAGAVLIIAGIVLFVFAEKDETRPSAGDANSVAGDFAGEGGPAGEGGGAAVRESPDAGPADLRAGEGGRRP